MVSGNRKLAWRRVAGNRQILGTSLTGSQDTRLQSQPLDLQSWVQYEGVGCLINNVLKISRQEEQRSKSGREPPEHSSPKPRALGDSREGSRTVGQSCRIGDSGD